MTTTRKVTPFGCPSCGAAIEVTAETWFPDKPDSLDAAWAEAEAAIKAAWGDDSYVEMLNITARSVDQRWAAHGVTRLGGWVAFGPTPAAALRALAGKLREKQS